MTERERAVAAIIIASDLSAAYKRGELVGFDNRLRRNKALSIVSTALAITDTENDGGEFMRFLNSRRRETAVPDFETDGTF